MGYSRDLDEFEEYELREELRRRYADQAGGCCDYCHRPFDAPACRFPQRHSRVARSLASVPAVARLVDILQDRPALLEEVLILLRVPVQRCEGHGHTCDKLVLRATSAMTMYTWDGQGEDPNRDLMLCPSCSMDYISDMEAQWSEYNAGRL